MKNIPAFLQITFSGRINRYRYLGYQIGSAAFLFVSLFTICAIIEHVILSLAIGTLSSFLLLPIKIWLTILALSFKVRRLHDLNHSGWWVLWSFILFSLLIFISITIDSKTLFHLCILISVLFFIYLLFFKGTAGPNKYGDDPLEYDDYQEYLDALSSQDENSTENLSDPKDISSHN